MTKLLRACVRRYTHNTIFWIAAVITIGLGISIAHSTRMTYYDDALVIAQMLIHAVMISWVVGKEFKEGIFRKKFLLVTARAAFTFRSLFAVLELHLCCISCAL